MIVVRVVSAEDRTDVRLRLIFSCLSEHFFDLELSHRPEQSTNTDRIRPFVCNFSPALIYVRCVLSQPSIFVHYSCCVERRLYTYVQRGALKQLPWEG